MAIGGRTPGIQYDAPVASGSLILSGALDVELTDGFVPADGDSFELFSGPTLGTFATCDLPALTGGLSWDSSRLDTDGVVSVVPEPSTFVLLGIGALALLGYAWRRRRQTPSSLSGW